MMWHEHKRNPARVSQRIWISIVLQQKLATKNVIHVKTFFKMSYLNTRLSFYLFSLIERADNTDKWFLSQFWMELQLQLHNNSLGSWKPSPNYL